jgi:hypothetical protein
MYFLNLNVYLQLILNIPVIVFMELISILTTVVIKWLQSQCDASEDHPSDLKRG